MSDDDKTKLADVATRKLIEGKKLTVEEGMAFEKRQQLNTEARKDKDAAEHWIKTMGGRLLKSIWTYVILLLSGSGIGAYLNDLITLGD
jgi:hypothetical protein